MYKMGFGEKEIPDIEKYFEEHPEKMKGEFVVIVH
jgi:hypothetical protein